MKPTPSAVRSTGNTLRAVRRLSNWCEAVLNRLEPLFDLLAPILVLVVLTAAFALVALYAVCALVWLFA